MNAKMDFFEKILQIMDHKQNLRSNSYQSIKMNKEINYNTFSEKPKCMRHLKRNVLFSKFDLNK